MPDSTEMNTHTFRVVSHGVEPMPFKVGSLDAASSHLPPGAYTSFRTYEGRKVLHLDEHLARLEHSARELDARARVTLSGVEGGAEFRHALGQVFDRTGFPESRVRVTLAVPDGEVYVSIQPFAGLAPELFERGAVVAACPYVAHATEAKATTSIKPLRGARAALPSWAHEGVMVDDGGFMLEGLSSNFFAVCAGVLRTASAGVLAGTTRALVLQLAADLLPVVLEPVRLGDLHGVTECFITSVSREVMPVVRVDEHVIGEGHPGAVTRELLRRFREHVRACAEPL